MAKYNNDKKFDVDLQYGQKRENLRLSRKETGGGELKILPLK